MIPKIIEIVSLPHGAAPEWVRREWIGCELPCEPECGHIPVYAESVLKQPRDRPMTAAEFMAEPLPEKIDGFSVHMTIALQVLSMHCPLAADWFERNGYPLKDKCFRFRLSEVKVLARYGHDEGGPIVRFNDMERGTLVRED